MRRPRARVSSPRVFLLLAFLLGLLAVCGKKGDPLPPLRPTPAAVTGFRLAQRGSELEITFAAPRAGTDGARLPVLEVELLIAEGEGDFGKQARGRRFKAAPGESFTERRPLPAPETYVRAAARAYARGHRGNLLEPARLIVRAPLAAPSELEARPAPEGVSLSWRGEVPAPLPTPASEAPAPATPDSPAPDSVTPDPALPTRPAETGPPGAPASLGGQATVEPPPPGAGTPPKAPGPKPTPKPTPTPFAPGFFVYRRAPTAEYMAPLQSVATPVPAYSDTTARPGESWCYVARAVASADPLVESAPSNEACVDVKDIVAPAPPAGLTILPKEDGAELTWSPSPEPDLRAYRVYRTFRRQRERIAEVLPLATTFLDKEALPSGALVRYTVTAVDQAGNESTDAEPVESRRP